MNSLVAKEIRLVLPAYAAALLLAIVPVWLFPNNPHNPTAILALYPFLFGGVLLALSSFGREFSLQTFSLILVQPVERSRIWWTKIAVLGCAMTTVLAALWLSCFACSQIWPGPYSSTEILIITGTFVVVSFAGGLWTTLLFRQMMAAFWFTLLIPGAILVAIATNDGRTSLLLTLLGLYSIAGFWWAWRQFLGAQEAGWTGGIVTLPAWRAAAAGAAARPSHRVRRPLAALFWKELQLHQISLIGMAWLFVLHIGIIALRKAGYNTFGMTVRSALQIFAGIWLIVPLLAGSPGVSEERKLGTMQSHMCLPISSRLQFAIKLLFVLVLGGLVSALLVWTAEGIASAVGAGADISFLKHPFAPQALISLSLNFLGLSLIGFLASTLARNLVQALAAAIVIALAIWSADMFASGNASIFGFPLWRGYLVQYIAVPTLIIMLLWFAWRNFRSLAESLWLRNALGILATLVSIAAFTSALYHRAWELITPLEPAHGQARISPGAPITFKSFGGIALTCLLPDGRLWVDRIAFDPGRSILGFSEGTRIRVDAKWTSLDGNRMAPGTNWTDACAKFRETVAIRDDGTLWASERARPGWNWSGQPPVREAAPLVRYGNDTNWQSVVAEYSVSVVLLKKDGTLWRWGTNSFDSRLDWPGLRAFKPQRLPAGSDWARILFGHGCVYAWKNDGPAWLLRPPNGESKTHEIQLEPGGLILEPVPAFDNIVWRSVGQYLEYRVAVRADGTLWAWTTIIRGGGRYGGNVPTQMMQIGGDRDWVDVAGNYTRLAAVKKDGSLWAWKRKNPRGRTSQLFWMAKESPIRLSRHTDWVGLGEVVGGSVSLAADGSLWHWRDGEEDYSNQSPTQPLLAPSRRPVLIENIFASQQ